MAGRGTTEEIDLVERNTVKGWPRFVQLYWQHRGRVERFRCRAVLVQRERWVSRNCDHSCPRLVGMETEVFSIWSSDLLLPEHPNLRHSPQAGTVSCKGATVLCPVLCLLPQEQNCWKAANREGVRFGHNARQQISAALSSPLQTIPGGKKEDKAPLLPETAQGRGPEAASVAVLAWEAAYKQGGSNATLGIAYLWDQPHLIC